MSDEVVGRIKSQIRNALERYNESDPKAAMLSGMSLAASYLAKLEGSKTITAQTVQVAVTEVATELGFVIGRLENTR